MAAIIFDLDGTLIDSAPDLRKAGNAMLSAEGLPAMSLGQARGYIGKGAAVFVDRMLADAGAEPDLARTKRVLAGFLTLYETAVHETRLYPGVTAALAQLRRQGWRIGLCTNKPTVPTCAVLRHFGLLDSFDTLICGDTLAERKPHPAPLLAAVTALGGPALYVGDGEVDAECAQRAGLRFLLFTEGYRKSPVEALPHAALFADFADLPEIVARIGELA